MKKGKAIEILNALAWVQGGPDREETITAISMAIEALQPDVVKVVRCGKCEYWCPNPNSKIYGACGKVSYDDFEVVMERDDFCSYGKPKGGDDTTGESL